MTERDARASADNNDESPDSPIVTSGWVEKSGKPKRRDFPVAGVFTESLRISIARQPHADIVAHAQSDLDRELCGVLLGEICEDDAGTWVSVEAALEGETDKTGGTHVTYTQETWEQIYKVKDERYPKLNILGWYHTHPGFGVEFSEMDTFIQRNFFCGRSQFALVIDPTTGDEAIIVNEDDDIAYVNGYWLDGKERSVQVPKRFKASAEGGAPMRDDDSLEDRLREIESRLNQVLQATSDQRDAHYRLFLWFGSLVALSVMVLIGYMIYETVNNKYSPPKTSNYVPVPIEIDGKPALLGLRLESWQIPNGANLIEKRAIELVQQLDAIAKDKATFAPTTSVPAPTNHAIDLPPPTNATGNQSEPQSLKGQTETKTSDQQEQ